MQRIVDILLRKEMKLSIWIGISGWNTGLEIQKSARNIRPVPCSEVLQYKSMTVDP